MSRATGPDGSRPTARDAARTWAELLLERALAGLGPRALPGSRPGADALRRLADFLDAARPVVCVVSPYAYVERLIAELVTALPGAPVRKLAVAELEQAWGRPTAGLPDFDDDSLLVLSFHEPGPLPPMLRFVHRLQTTDNPVLIGCGHPSQVPEALRARVDVELELAALDGSTFARAFERLFGAPPPDPGDDAWLRGLEPGDLQNLLQLGCPADEAYGLLRSRVSERLEGLRPPGGPSLDDLHGMGEARDVARDMVAEIRAAREGRIEWRDLDRGMLLAGPPGTGKTTLVKALGRESGIDVIVASAASWQSTQNLGEHLAAIRRSFEEARRHQPCILFIDEMDALGSRERLSGNGAEYQRNVINYLLEQLDGFAGRQHVIVIGATNHEHSVDPALRRSGRLDQTVQVPFPTSAALAQIYGYHLRRHQAAGRCADDIDVDELGRISFGLTGADVEFAVRGAARRARRRDDPIRHEDLVAEILRKPRAEAAHERLDGSTVRRLAVHEAGHALARLRSESGGREIAYVSIAPRSDGRIGHMAIAPSGEGSATRADLLQRLRTLLAGRAAEEAVFGEDGVSLLAGNRGPESDLARATALATALHGSSGLDVGDLLWLEAVGAGARAELQERVEDTLGTAYQQALALVQQDAPALDRIAQILIDEQEISGSRLRALL